MGERKVFIIAIKVRFCYNKAKNKPTVFLIMHIRKAVSMYQKKRFEDLQFRDGFLFAATLEDEFNKLPQRFCNLHL